MKQGIFTWRQLNTRLRELTSEKAVLELLEQQKRAGASTRWTHRIYARFSLLRRRRERRQIAQ